MAQRILVIKLGALGNVVLSLGPFAAIRRHHAGAHITVLTTKPYADWLAKCPYFDDVWIDERPEWWDLRGWGKLRKRLIEGHFDRVYDLQTSGRSSRYFQLFPRNARPEWSGIAIGCSHPDRDPNRNHLHDIERQAGQLRAAGVTEAANADLSWSQGDIARFNLPGRFALLAPGSSPLRLLKRWPIENYARLASMLLKQGLVPVIIGSEAEHAMAETIAATAPAAIDLTGQTNFADLASLGRAATLAVGNDTGTMHMFATVGCPCIVLFSHDSDPALCAPRGRCVKVLQRHDLSMLDVDTVFSVVDEIVPPHGDGGLRPPYEVSEHF